MITNFTPPCCRSSYVRYWQNRRSKYGSQQA